jgi:hypothetical protein
MGDEWWIPPHPGQRPSLGEHLRGARWPLLSVVVAINAAAGYWLWTALGRGAYFAAALGGTGLFLLDLVCGALALYAWLSRRR